MLLRRVIIAGSMLLAVLTAAAGDASGQPALEPAPQLANQQVITNYSPEYPPLGPAYSAIRPDIMREDAARLLRDSPGTRRPAPDLLNFLGTHLPVEQGMLGGFWSFASIPGVCTVTFTNAERTRATVAIRASYSGGALEMAKEGGRWTVVGMVARYVN